MEQLEAALQSWRQKNGLPADAWQTAAISRAASNALASSSEEGVEEIPWNGFDGEEHAQSVDSFDNSPAAHTGDHMPPDLAETAVFSAVQSDEPDSDWTDNEPLNVVHENTGDNFESFDARLQQDIHPEQNQVVYDGRLGSEVEQRLGSSPEAHKIPEATETPSTFNAFADFSEDDFSSDGFSGGEGSSPFVSSQEDTLFSEDNNPGNSEPWADHQDSSIANLDELEANATDYQHTIIEEVSDDNYEDGRNTPPSQDPGATFDTSDSMIMTVEEIDEDISADSLVVEEYSEEYSEDYSEEYRDDFDDKP